MNLIIDDFDHQLIIKVASVQQSRMQVYFIDNEESISQRDITLMIQKEISCKTMMKE